MKLVSNVYLHGSALDEAQRQVDEWVSRPPINTSKGKPLTPTEKEIHSRIILGLSNKEIAEILGVTSNSVNCHITVIVKKLGLSNRSELRNKA